MRCRLSARTLFLLSTRSFLGKIRRSTVLSDLQHRPSNLWSTETSLQPRPSPQEPRRSSPPFGRRRAAEIWNGDHPQ